MKAKKPIKLKPDEIAERIETILRSIDVGGEQSRQFAYEIKILNQLLQDLDHSKK